MLLDPAFWAIIATAALVFWRLPEPSRTPALAAGSWIWIATVDVVSAALLATWGLWALACSRRPVADERSTLRDPRWPFLAILGVLVAVKVAPVVGHLVPGGPSRTLLVPLGISYFSFRLLHVLVELRRGTLQGLHAGDFLAWLFLPPLLASGPIERYDHFLAHRELRWSSDLLVEGLQRIAHGLIKKLVFADLVLSPLLGVYREKERFLATFPELPVSHVWAVVALSVAVLYLDFAGYSDLAIGASLLFGFRIQENFDHPWLARDLNDFWKRWHMSLTGWCQAYVFLPVLGRTRSPRRAVLATFVVMGAWHAPTLHWVLWGLFHAAGVVLVSSWSRLRRRRRWRFPEGLPFRLLGRAATGAFVCASFALVVPWPEADGAVAVRLFLALFGLSGSDSV